MPTLRLTIDRSRTGHSRPDMETYGSAAADALARHIGADPRLVQVIVIDARIAFGQPILLELAARDKPDRTAERIAALLAEIDELTQRHFGATARIRYRAVAEGGLHARN